MAMAAPAASPGLSRTTIPRVLAETVARCGDRVAIVDGEISLSYADLAGESRKFGAALIAAGVSPGDRVAIWAFNSAEWVIAALGLWQAGATLVPVNTRFKGAEAVDILGRSSARVLVTVTDFLGTDYVALLRETGTPLPNLETTVVVRGPVPDGAQGWSDFLATSNDEALAELDRRIDALSTDDPSDILFTSGTTGKPKGVVMTHGRTLTVALDWVKMTGLNPADRYLMVNPYFHMFGLKAGILASIGAGATMLPESVFDVERALARIASEKVTVFPGAPTIYQTILDVPDRSRYDLSSLRLAVTGAADIPVALIRRIREELPFRRIISGYGLTEAGTATATVEDDDVETIATTVGRLRPGFEARIVDGDGNDVATGVSGEILLRGGSVMLHYLDDPDATAATLSPDGWLRTGDLATMDDKGNIKIVGRAKDMYIVGGFNVYPAEVEDLLRGHPDIRDAAVIGIPDPRLGEVGMAFVVLRSGATATPQELIAWSREQMANYKAPRVIDIIDELPVNATGKVEKKVLRDRVSQG
jgi:acyl-CoA synthetase (AMP-forming)/AMP-acid ligase II